MGARQIEERRLKARPHSGLEYRATSLLRVCHPPSIEQGSISAAMSATVAAYASRCRSGTNEFEQRAGRLQLHTAVAGSAWN